jgi:hypothetical protein
VSRGELLSAPGPGTMRGACCPGWPPVAQVLVLAGVLLAVNSYVGYVPARPR